MHELGHYVIPWHRDPLYYCPILRLPPKLQEQFEREADEFAAEMFFFGSRFVEEAMSAPFGLAAPLELASGRYDVSLHSAFWRYAERNPRACCLLVSEPTLSTTSFGFDLELKYYVKSKGFHGRFQPNQLCPSSSRLGQLFSSGALDSSVEHELHVGDENNNKVYMASSISNSYKVFTLIWEPTAPK